MFLRLFCISAYSKRYSRAVDSKSHQQGSNARYAIKNLWKFSICNAVQAMGTPPKLDWCLGRSVARIEQVQLSLSMTLRTKRRFESGRSAATRVLKLLLNSPCKLLHRRPLSDTLCLLTSANASITTQRVFRASRLFAGKHLDPST